MKIKSIQLNNFRTYKDLTTFKIKDKNIILLYGNNGYGKTSFFDGIEWGITGEISRYNKNGREKSEYPILTNYFNDSLEGSVEIHFSDGNNIKRKTILNKSKGINKGSLDGNLKKILRENSDETKNKLEKQFTLSHLLCQETINSFIRETDEKKRYESFLLLYGFTKTDGYKEKIKQDISKINKLLFDNNQNIISSKETILNVKSELLFNNNDFDLTISERNVKNFFKIQKLDFDENELELKEKLSDITYKIKTNEEKYEILKQSSLYEEQIKNIALTKKIKKILEELSKNVLIKKIKMNQNSYLEYLKMTQNLEEKKEIKNNLNFELEQIKNLNEIEKVINFFELKSLEMTKIKFFKRLQKSIKIKEAKLNELQKFKDTISELTSRFFSSSKALLVENKELKVCPLCKKDKFDRKKILERIENNLKAESTPEIIKINKKIKILIKNKTILEKNKDILKEAFEKKISVYKNSVMINLEQVNDFFIELKNMEEKYKSVKENLDKLYIAYDDFDRFYEENNNFILENVKKEELEYEKELNALLDNINFEKVKRYNELKNSSITKKELAIDIQTLIKKKINYEEIMKDLLKLKSYYKDNETLKELKKNEKELSKNEKSKIILEIAKNDFQNLSNGIDTYIYDKIKSKSKDYEEIILKFYKYLNPHENFNKLRIVVKKNETQSNNLRFEIYNDDMKGKAVSPAYIFSSAQNNVLAIAIFLSFAIDSKWSKLEAIFLDDPIQNMDDINIYAFTDLMKKLSEKKQIFLSTHDHRVMEFMKMKFGEENIQIIEFNGYGKIDL